MKKLGRMIIMTLVITVMSITTVFAQAEPEQLPWMLGVRKYSASDLTWSSDGSQWTCTLNRTGEAFKDRWLAVYEKKGKYLYTEWYRFDNNGIMQTGWVQEGDKTFYLKPDGRMIQGESVETIDGKTYVFAYQNYLLKNGNITIDGVAYRTDENGCVITNIADKTRENTYPSGQSDQLDYLNAYRRQKGISDLSYDSDLTGVARAAYDYGSSINLSTAYSLAVNTGHNIRHIAYIRATAGKDSSYIYLTEDAVDAIQNLWFTRVGYYKADGTILVIMAAYDQEEAAQLPAEETPGTWINSEGKFKYLKADDTYVVNTWFKNPADGKWYHFDESGYMQIGWFQDTDGKWYYLSPETGEMMTDTTVDGYSIGPDGVRYE